MEELNFDIKNNLDYNSNTERNSINDKQYDIYKATEITHCVLKIRLKLNMDCWPPCNR